MPGMFTVDYTWPEFNMGIFLPGWSLLLALYASLVGCQPATEEPFAKIVPEAAVLDEVRTTYDGEVVLADDLDRF